MMTAQQLPPDEPMLDGDEIQGNVVPGFMKAHQDLLVFRIRDVHQARAFLRELAPTLTTLNQAMPSVLAVRAGRTLQPSSRQLGLVPPAVDDVWTNIAVSYMGLELLLGRDHPDLTSFEDMAFKRGLAARSGLLGDPRSEQAEGHPSNWVVGGEGSEPDLLLIAAADNGKKLKSHVDHLLQAAAANGLDLLHHDSGAKFDQQGSEHFGFQDGISQPGVRGTTADHGVVTSRTIADDATPDCWLYGLPGQLLVWPGEFIFGYPGASADPLVPGGVKLPGPDWSRNGSYVVFRRLRQDVHAFWNFMETESKRLQELPGFASWDAHRLAAALVGRWKSGAPLVVTPNADDEDLGHDRLRNNSFGFAKKSEPLPLKPPHEPNGEWPPAVADPIGLVCPLGAHIRKVNSREAPNDLGASRASLDRRILRRGLPYGAKAQTDPTQPEHPAVDRGLLFVSYQTSIEDQFEFLNTRWMGSRTNPRSPGGHDMIVGQNGQPGEGRTRTSTLLSAGGAAEVSTEVDFVIPTGGGYFFSPSITAVRNVLGRARKNAEHT